MILLLMGTSCLAGDDYAASKEKNGVPAVATAPGDKNALPDEPPEGYYAFVESPNAEPPKVRPPPYKDSDKECTGTFLFLLQRRGKVFLNNFVVILIDRYGKAGQGIRVDTQHLRRPQQGIRSQKSDEAQLRGIVFVVPVVSIK